MGIERLFDLLGDYGHHGSTNINLVHHGNDQQTLLESQPEVSQRLRLDKKEGIEEERRKARKEEGF